MIIQCNKIFSATTGEEMEESPWVNKGKKYVVLMLCITIQEGVMAAIQSDHYRQPIFKKLKGFEVISQKIPKNWTSRISQHFYYLMPKSWSYDTFLEDLEDEKPSAMNLYKKEAAIMYAEEGMVFET